jgi:hypothetical protein
MLPALFILLLLPAADVLKAPSIPAESGSVIVSEKTEGVRWRANWTMEPAQRAGKNVVRFTEQGQGRLSPFEGEVKWSIEAVWLAENGLRPLETEKIVTGSDGVLLSTERKHFDWAKGKVRFERESKGKSKVVRTVSVPPDTLTVEGIAGILRFLPFDSPEPFRAHLFTNEPDLYEVEFKNRGKELIKTPTGEYESYKIELIPDVGILNLFRSFVPKSLFWFTVSPPHFWVRYEGTESGPGTPKIIMELDSFEQ